jgi:hypothetical protein
MKRQYLVTLEVDANIPAVIVATIPEVIGRVIEDSIDEDRAAVEAEGDELYEVSVVSVEEV